MGAVLNASDVLATFAGLPPTYYANDKAILAARNIAGALQAQSADIAAWEAKVATLPGRGDWVSSRAAALNDMLTISRNVLGAHGMYLAAGSGLSQADAAANARIPVSYLTKVYGARSFAPYEIFFVPKSAPVELAEGDCPSAGRRPRPASAELWPMIMIPPVSSPS